MDILIPKGNLHPPALKNVLDIAQVIIKNKKGEIQLTTLLSIINFPADVNKRIKRARGNLIVSCNKNKCDASNSGREINEKIPGGNGFVSLMVGELFKCNYHLESSGEKRNRKLVIFSIKGLEIDIPGPFNPDVVEITIKEPNYVQLKIGG